MVKEATEDLDDLDAEFEALSTARNIELDHAEAILRVEMGSSVNKMSSKELKERHYAFC